MHQDDKRANLRNPHKDTDINQKAASGNNHVSEQRTMNSSEYAAHKASSESFSDAKPKKCISPAIITSVVMLLFIGAEFLLKTDVFNNQNPYVSLVVIQFFVFILPCAFVSAVSSRKVSGGLSDYSLRLFPPRMLGFVFSAFAVMLFGNMLLKYLGYVLFGFINKSTVLYDNDNMAALIAATVLVPAIVEEILMRGTVYAEYEKKGVGAFGAVIGSSIMFAFIHFDPQNFVSYLFSGIILAISHHVTKSLFAPVIIHLLNNTICIFTDTFLKRVSKESISSIFVIFLLSVLLLIAIFVFLESLEWICASKADKSATSNSKNNVHHGTRLIPVKTSIGDIFSCIFLNPAFAVVVIIYLLRIIIVK